MLLYVTRHGETDYNVSGRYCGSTDVPLNEKGIAQAHELAGRVQGMALDAVISSPMLRARQTTEIVCAAMHMRYSIYEQFTERNVGVYEGLTREEAREKYPHLWNRQCARIPDDAPDGGETLRQACDRIDEGIRLLRQNYRGKKILLICHGFAARAVHRCCRNLTFDEMAGFTLENCEIAEYVI